MHAPGWLTLGSTGSKQLPFSRLPSSLPSLHPPFLPTSSFLRPPWTWAAGWSPEGRDAGRQSPPREEGLRGGRLPCGRMARAGEGPRAEAADPSPRHSGRSEGEVRGGRRKRVGSSRSLGPWGPRRLSRRVSEAWKGASGSQALPARGPGSGMCYFCLLAFHKGFAPLSLNLHLLCSTSFDIFLLSRQLEMTGPENSSDIRGQPAPSRRFQGATSNPPPTPFPPKPLQPPRSGRPLLSARLPARLLLRFLSSPYQTVLELVVYLAASDSSGRSFLEDRTKPFLSFESHVNLNMLPAV